MNRETNHHLKKRIRIELSIIGITIVVMGIILTTALKHAYTQPILQDGLRVEHRVKMGEVMLYRVRDTETNVVCYVHSVGGVSCAR